MPLPLLQSAALAADPGVRHGFTTAADGAGGAFDLGVHAPAGAWERAAEAIGMPGRPVARMSQVHGAAVVEAQEGGLAGEADAILCRAPGVVLAVRVADCVPVLLRGRDGVGAVHAGWRGVAAEVVPAAVGALGPTPLAVIGPCICAACYEVGDEVVAGIGARVPAAVFLRSGPRRAHADLRAAVAWQLRQAGVGRIEGVEACTRCRDDLHSHRRDGARSGRIAGLVALA